MWGLLVFYALAASVWTVALWMKGLQGLHAHEAGVFTIFLPITAAAVGVTLLNESMNGAQLLAFAVALASVVLISLRPAERKTDQWDG
jgi:drug/metabolite transporter (DMT)-like permease